jgi:hypothetical protein
MAAAGMLAGRTPHGKKKANRKKAAAQKSGGGAEAGSRNARKRQKTQHLGHAA